VLTDSIRVAEDGQTVVVLAQVDESALQIIRGLVHLFNLTRRRVFRGDQMPFLGGERFERRAFVEAREALGLDVLGIAIEQAVVHARLGEGRVLLHVEKPGEFLLARVPDFHHARPVAEVQARRGEVRGQRRPA
jgi:hypothetical protein